MPLAIGIVALVFLAIPPYSFLTYLDHIPSRNTYLPSIGLAGINGILFAAAYRKLASARARVLATSFLCAVVAGNVAYIWLKKDPQYVERASPTRALIEVLNASNVRKTEQLPIVVCGFPLHPWIGQEAVVGFTQLRKEDVVFSENCDERESNPRLAWDQQALNFVRSQ
jgi:hypothetical protein